MLGFSKVQYVSGNWEVNVSGPVVLEPTYLIEMRCSDAEVFEWTGSIDQDGVIIDDSAE